MSETGRPFGPQGYGEGPYSTWHHVDLAVTMRGRARLQATATLISVPDALRVRPVLGRSSLTASLELVWVAPPVGDIVWAPDEVCDASWAAGASCDTTWTVVTPCGGALEAING